MSEQINHFKKENLDNVVDILRTLKQKQKNDTADRLSLSKTETAQEE